MQPITIIQRVRLFPVVGTWLYLLEVAWRYPFQASPTLPILSMGRFVHQNHPRRAFYGTVNSSGATLLTNSNTEMFVITTLITSSASVDLYQDTTKLYDSRSYGAYYGMCNSLCKGKVKIPIAAGTSLRLQSTNGASYEYYLEGYYTQP